MIVSADQVADTLRLLVPGFVMMKTFYVFGLATRRSDAEWAIWSLLAAVPVNGVAQWLSRGAGKPNFALALIVGLVGGIVLTWAWKGTTRVWPQLGQKAAIRSWDVVFGRDPAPWLEIQLHDGRLLSGYAENPASSVDTDELDLFLRSPKLITGAGYQDMPGLEGILIARSEISTIAVIQM